MSLKLLYFVVASAFFMLSPVHAEAEKTGSTQAVTSPMEDRVRAYRERFEQRDQRRQQQEVEFERRREEANKRREAMQKYYSEKMQARLTIIEQRQQQIAARHEADRNRAQDRYNYLSSNSEALMNKALETQLEVAKRHEDIRKQAEERHKKIAAHRDAMMGMTMQERRIYMDEHASDMFGLPAAAGARSFAPRHPPWMNRQSHPAHGHVQGKPCRFHPTSQTKKPEPETQQSGG